MSIVLEETLWAQDAIDNKDIGKSPYETLRRVARYYIDCGKTKEQVRNEVNAFLLACIPTASIVRWKDTIDTAIAQATKHAAVDIGSIAVTKNEMTTIQSISIGRRCERLAFTLLCLSKFWNIYNGTTTNWVYNSDTSIMRYANIKTSSKNQYQMYHQLKEAGLVAAPYKVDSASIRVLFPDDESVPVVRINNFTDLGNQYLMYLGEPYFQCAECGAVSRYQISSAGRRPKYCKDCAAVVTASKKRVFADNLKKIL